MLKALGLPVGVPRASNNVTLWDGEACGGTSRDGPIIEGLPGVVLVLLARDARLPRLVSDAFSASTGAASTKPSSSSLVSVAVNGSLDTCTRPNVQLTTRNDVCETIIIDCSSPSARSLAPRLSFGRRASLPTRVATGASKGRLPGGTVGP